MSALPSGAFVVFEAADGHERLLMETLKAARVLAEIGASLDLRPLWSVEAERQRPAELAGRRDAIVAALSPPRSSARRRPLRLRAP